MSEYDVRESYVACSIRQADCLNTFNITICAGITWQESSGID